MDSILVPMKNTRTRLSVTIDPDALEEARKLTGAKTKRQTIERAVDEMVKSQKRNVLADLIGTGVFGVTESELRRRRHQKHGRSK